MTHLLNWLVDQGLTVAVAVSAAFAIFKLLGSHWMEAQFSKRLEEVKHGQNQELERLRYRINALMDRTSKLHQHEFEVLPELWHKLGIAYTSTKHFTSRILKQHDLNNMSYGELADFLA